MISFNEISAKIELEKFSYNFNTPNLTLCQKTKEFFKSFSKLFHLYQYLKYSLQNNSLKVVMMYIRYL